MIPTWPRAIMSAILFLLFGLAGSLLAPSVALAAEPDPVSEACFRSQKLLNGGVIVPKHVADVARYHCDFNGHAAILADLRPQNEWGAPRSNRPCDSLPKKIVSAGSPGERLEAECVASWYEYSQYLVHYSGCLKAANEAMSTHMQRSMDRIDLRPYCTDKDIDPAVTAERNKDEAVLGTFGILGWICLTVVVLCTVFPVAYRR